MAAGLKASVSKDSGAQAPLLQSQTTTTTTTPPHFSKKDL